MTHALTPPRSADAEDVLRQASTDAAYRRYLHDLLMELLAIDTTPKADVVQSARAEGETFTIIARELEQVRLGPADVLRRPIDPAIVEHPAFTPLYYTRTPDRPEGLDAAACYAERGNLVYAVTGTNQGAGPGVHQALNVHIDVVAPYLPPTSSGGRIQGRGACDDKGNVVALIGALRLLHVHLKGSGGALARNLTCMFVIDEETGGNGSLSLALDRQLCQRYDSMLVLECTSSVVHPGNRGCVWYRLSGSAPGVNLLEAAAFILEELETEGRAIRAESVHELFPQRPVQTSHGIIGSSGEHPSRVSGAVTVQIRFDGGALSAKTRALLRGVLTEGLRQYVGLYGDKFPSATGAVELDNHCTIARAAGGLDVEVRGVTGHMGSIEECDGAITKMAALIRSLVHSRALIEASAGGRMRLKLADWPDASRLLLEGGQGFLPTHTLAEVERRMRSAVVRGARRYGELVAFDGDLAACLELGFEKLHNAAYACAANGREMQNAIAAAKAAGSWSGQPVRGWEASCDARLFATTYPDLPVLTVGAGPLECAHSDREYIDVDEMARMAEFLARYILAQTGAEHARRVGESRHSQ